MEDIINIVVQNGLGVASFIALLLFIFKYQEKNEECLTKIATTLTQMQISFEVMTDRIDKIEEKINRKED